MFDILSANDASLYFNPTTLCLYWVQKIYMHVQGPVFAILGAWFIYHIQNKEINAKEAENVFQKAVIVTGLSLILNNFERIDDWYVIDPCLSLYYPRKRRNSSIMPKLLNWIHICWKYFTILIINLFRVPMCSFCTGVHG